MDLTCHECGSKLVASAESREAPRREYLRSRGSSGDASKIKHVTYRCPSCRKTRAASAETEGGWF